VKDRPTNSSNAWQDCGTVEDKDKGKRVAVKRSSLDPPRFKIHRQLPPAAEGGSEIRFSTGSDPLGIDILGETASTQPDVIARPSVLVSGNHENDNLFSAHRGARLRSVGRLRAWSSTHGTTPREAKHAHRTYAFQCQPFLVHIARPVVSYGVRHSALKRVCVGLGEIQPRSGVGR
jgi:hypothetical protein